jgi:hypothetical protein
VLKSGAVLAAACLLTAQATIAAAVDGAFGLEFDQPAPQQRLSGAALALPPPPPFEWQVPADAPPDVHGRRFVFVPSALPRILNDIEGDFSVQLGVDDHPIRISARLVSACARAADIEALLARKYPRLSLEPGADSTALALAGFGDRRRQLTIYCERDADTLVLDYLDVDAYRVWEARARDRYAVWQDERLQAAAAAEVARQEAEAQRAQARDAATERARAEQQAAQAQRTARAAGAASLARRELLDHLISGSSRRIESVFGIPLREPVAGIPAFVPDVALPVTRSGVVAPFDHGEFALELDPEAMPISIRGVFESNDADAMAETLALALRERHGPPMKDQPRHRIFDVSGDYIVLKRTAPNVLEVVVIRQAGLQAQRRRVRAAAAAAEAQRARQFEQDTRGL